MIAYEMQLRFVIRDKIRSKTKSENFFSDNFFFFLSGKNIYWEKIFDGKKNSQILSWTEFSLRFPVHFFELSLTQIDAYHY